MCYDGGKNGIEKILIFLKLQVEQEREGDRATSRSDQSSLWPQCIRLEAIVRAFATSQLSCSWVGRWNDALVLCCAAWCLLFLLFVLLLCVLGNREKVEVDRFQFLSKGIKPPPTLLLLCGDCCGFILHRTVSCTRVGRWDFGDMCAAAEAMS